MGLQLKKENGKVLGWWYADYVRPNGKRTVVNLNVPVEGTPPKSGKVSDRGSADFERSRRAAAAKLDGLRKEGAGARVTKREALRQYVEATGEPLDIPALDALLTARDAEPRKRNRASVAFEKAILREFVDWARERGAVNVMDITLALAKQFLGAVYNPNNPRYAAGTARKIKGLLAIALDRTLPEGVFNPFRHASLRIDTIDGDQQFHREPLRPAEVERLLAVAFAIDPEAHDWIVCALSTGLRRGDVCRLRWDTVDTSAGALRVTTSKTGAELHLPIMPGLADVLARRKAIAAEGDPFVFPEAAALYTQNETAITRRVKKIFARAFSQEPGATMKKDIANLTRKTRAIGKRAASVRDFHALRTTFVTLAISAGIPADILRALTGHSTVDLVIKHYFKPKGTDFAPMLEKALPDVLTKKKP